jgi:hypothetical protein
MATEDPESMPGAVPDATEPDPSEETPSAATKGSPYEITPVSAPIDRTAGDGCSAAPIRANGSAAGGTALFMLVASTIVVLRRRRRD